MPTPGSMTRAAAFAACLLLTNAVRAHAQPLPSPSTAPASADLMSHYNFQLSMNTLAIDDQRFSWNAHFGGDVDLFDYVFGRANVVIDYEAIMGNEYRPFDPNQGNYTLEASGSARVRGAEFAGVFHHVSRHLSDRPKQFPIAWNTLGVRALRRVPVGGGTVDAQASVSRIVRHSYVDYVWTGNVDVVARRPVTTQVAVFVHGFGELYAVDGTSPDRGTQAGGRFEAGVRLGGRGGAAELFAGYEERLDADPIDRQPHRWGLVGFRFVAP